MRVVIFGITKRVVPIEQIFVMRARPRPYGDRAARKGITAVAIATVAGN